MNFNNWMSETNNRSKCTNDISIKKTKYAVYIRFFNGVWKNISKTGFVAFGDAKGDRNILCFEPADKSNGRKLYSSKSSANKFLQITDRTICENLAFYVGEYDAHFTETGIIVNKREAK